MTAVARYPDSTKASLEQRLRSRARDRWPQIASLHIRHRGNFSYVDAALADGTMLKLCRLRYVGSASQWQFAIYRASHDDYDESVFPTGLPVGTCQDALDTACGLYLNDPTAWIQPPTNLRARQLRFRLPGWWRGEAGDGRGGLEPVGRPEFAQDVRDVDADGLDADDERRGDLAVGVAAGEEVQDLRLARGQAEDFLWAVLLFGERGRRGREVEPRALGEQLEFAEQ